MKSKKYIAVDLGAESGRVTIATYDGKHIRLEEIHRFKTEFTELSGTIYWDIQKLFNEIKNGLKLCAKHSDKFEGIGVDTWGVDFGLLDNNNKLLGNPVHYRDKRTDGMMEKVFNKIPRKDIYQATGIQFMQINTLYQIYSMALHHPDLLKKTNSLLLMPSLINFFLCGEKLNEYTMATTTQCYDAKNNDWAKDILQKLNIPAGIFAPVVKPGTVLGKLLPEISKETGLKDVTVIAVGSHDTASAVAAVPAKSDNWAFLSSGTWSLLGCEINKPLINEQALKYDFTNEGGVEGTTRLLKNVMGLWIVQECRRPWEKDGETISYQDIVDSAEKSKPFQSFIDVNDTLFLKAGDMPGKVQAWCKKSGQNIPTDKGAIIRCILESLAFKYREVLEKLEILQDKSIDTIHIVGGGTQNKLLCQLTADATGKKVVAGPVEATVAGNIIMQCIAKKDIASLAKGREILSNSFDLITYKPNKEESLETAYKKYLSITGSRSV